MQEALDLILLEMISSLGFSLLWPRVWSFLLAGLGPCKP